MNSQNWPNPELQPGTRASWVIWTDVYPVVVTKRTRTKVWAEELPAKQAPGHEWGSQRWEIGDEPEPGARELVFTHRKDGRWKLAGSRTREIGNSLRPGCRRYHDYGF